MDTPTISIITPAYNEAQYISRAIDSVLTQTYPHWELLLINDASTDQTQSIIDSYTDPRIKSYPNNTNLGLAKSRNKAIHHAQGQYLTILDADDTLPSDSLESRINTIQNHPLLHAGINITYHDQKTYVPPLNTNNPDDINLFLHQDRPTRNQFGINIHTFLWEKSLNHFFQEDPHKQLHHDYVFFLELLTKHTAIILNHPVYNHTRKDTNSLNATERKEPQYYIDWQTIEAHYLPLLIQKAQTSP